MMAIRYSEQTDEDWPERSGDEDYDRMHTTKGSRLWEGTTRSWLLRMAI